MSQQGQHKRIIIQLARFLILSNSIREVAFHFISHAQQPVSKVKVLVHLQGLSQLLDSFVVLPCLNVSVPEIRINDYRERIKLKRFFYFSDGFVESLSLRQIGDAIPVMGCGIVRIQLNSSPKFPLSLRKVTIIVKQCGSQ